MDEVFKALADPTRRGLLDELFREDGQTLTALEQRLPMTRIGVMKHLNVLEEAGLITTRREGREKRHFLNPVPIRLVHDRWIGKFAEPVVGAMAAMKRTLEAEAMSAPDHVYSVYIKASPDRVWRAITDGNETVRYYYGTRVASDWSSGSPLTYAYPDGSTAADGIVLEIEPGRRVVMAFHPRWDPEAEAEGPIRMTWEVEATDDGGSKLTVTSALKPGSKAAEGFTSGIVYIVSGLKTFVETGEPLTVR